jgi:TolB-like protein
MKNCPECKRVYADQTLNYCLDDGSELLYGAREPDTAVMSDKPSEAAARRFEPTPTSRSFDERIAAYRKSIAVGVTILLIAALGIGGYLYYGRGSSRQIGSIAVMPFSNESGNPEVEYLSDGMTETLIASLSQLPNLNVKARSSVFRYKGKGTDAQTIGKELNVQAILNGRVVQRGQDLILNVELIDAKTENVLWTENYSRKMANLVSLQSEIAREVAQKLKTKLSGSEEQKLAKKYTESAEAYDLYLKGISYFNKRGPQNIEMAIGYYQQAIAIDPNFALAYAGLADAYAQPAQQPKGMQKARVAAQKALSLDQNLAEAHTVLGRVLMNYDCDFAGAENEYQRAIEINPNLALAHARYGSLLTYLGKFEAAERELRRSVELEPLSPAINHNYASALINFRRYDDAITYLKKAVELDENFFLSYGSMARAYQLKHDYQASVEAQVRSSEFAGNAQQAAGIRDSFERGGWEGYLRFRIRDFDADHNEGARIYAQLGEKDKAFAALNTAYENREFGIQSIKVDPLLDPLRDDLRFGELLRKVGFPE